MSDMERDALAAVLHEVGIACPEGRTMQHRERSRHATHADRLLAAGVRLASPLPEAPRGGAVSDLEALAKLASKATPGPWDHWDLTSWDTEPANAAYIAGASPDVVLALIRVAQMAEFALAALNDPEVLGEEGKRRLCTALADLTEAREVGR